MAGNIGGGGTVIRPVNYSNDSIQSAKDLYVNGNISATGSSSLISCTNLTCTGSIGIGVTNPAAALHVVGGELLKQSGGNNMIQIDFDPNAKIELKGGQPYIDFSTDTTTDFMSRLQQTNSNTFTISSPNIQLNGTLTNNQTNINLADQNPFYGIVGNGIISSGNILVSAITGLIQIFENRISFGRVGPLLYLSGAITFRTNTASGTISFAKSTLGFGTATINLYSLVNASTGVSYAASSVTEDANYIYISYSGAATGSTNTNYTSIRILFGLGYNNGY